MSVSLRLKRRGMKKFPSYRIVAMHRADRRDGAYIDDVGYYNPSASECEVNKDKILELLSKGAVPTKTVKDILKSKGIMKEFNSLKQKKAE